MIEIQTQSIVWFAPLGLLALYGVLNPSWRSPFGILLGASFVGLVGIIFVGTAIASVQIDESVRATSGDED